jgi:hypothetical protein
LKFRRYDFPVWVFRTQMLVSVAKTSRRPERDPWALSGPLAGVSFVASLVALNALAQARYPMPGADSAVIRRYFSEEHGPARLGAAAQLVCAASVAVFTRSAAALAARARPRSLGLRAATMAGGALAAGSLSASAVTTAALTTRRGQDDASADELYRFMFVTGGPVHGVGLGMLVGSLGAAGLRTGALPRRLSKAALASSVAGALSPLALIAKPALVFIPLGRLSALAVTGVAGVQLARARA